MKTYVSSVLVLLVLVFMLGFVDYGREKFNKAQSHQMLAGNPALVARLAGKSGSGMPLEQLADDERVALQSLAANAQRAAYVAFAAKALLVAGFAWIVMRMNRKTVLQS
jgi:uncharacterized membrane protein YphA (DoxX/SURF4 family)